AWVGGINHRHFQYDHVTAQRQVGSTFKPLIYAAALNHGVDPCEYIPNEKVVYPTYKNWAPGNSDGKYEGFYSLKGGLVKSVNTVSAAVMMKVGVEPAAKFAENFGFTHALPHDPSLVLGTADLSVQEMVGAYSAFANRGVRSVPVCVVKITDSHGKVLVEWPQERGRHRVMTTVVADQMVNMLQAVVDSGTARRLRYTYGLRTQIAGKTGTTQNHTDGWFMGVTPQLVVGTWVGGDDRQVRFRSLSLGQGANTALPIFGLFMKKVYQDQQYRNLRNAQFPEPNLGVIRSLDCPLYSENGLNASDNLIDLLRRLQNEREERRQQREQDDETFQDRWDRFFNRRKNNGGQ
ncbi:MAG: penicillin-binding transpeptidase domain-containing protein, partial [Bacteroidota bacterium]